MLVKDHLCKIDQIRNSFHSHRITSSQVAFEQSTRLSLKENAGLGLSEDDPMAFVVVVELQGDEKRGPPPKPRSLPDSVPREPRYRLCQRFVCHDIDSHVSTVYYRIYNKGGAINSRMSFNPDDEFLGRIDTLSVTPPHTVSSLGSRIANAEGIVKNKVQLFEDTDSDHLMNDNKHLPLEQMYPGCAEDEPLAVVCVEVMEEKQTEPQMLEGKTKEDATFSKLIMYYLRLLI